MTSQAYSVIAPISQQPADPIPVLRQTLSKTEWEDLKPLIQRLYIDDNQSFRKIATILRDRYGYGPTKRQFDLRIALWGFRKNATKVERRRIVETGSHKIAGIAGKVVSQTTRLRWEKEFKSKLPIAAGEVDVASAQSRANRLDNLPLASSSSHVETLRSHTVKPLTQPDIWPWAPSLIDIPGSPELSRLFEALEIHCPHDIEPISLPEPIINQSTERTYFHPSEFEINALLKPSETSSSNQGASLCTSQQTLDCSEAYSMANAHGGRSLMPRDWIGPSPYTELYPFPSSYQSASQGYHYTVSPGLSFSTLDARANGLVTALYTFGNTMSRHNPIYLRSMEEVASTFFQMREFAQAASWWKKLVKSWESLGQEYKSKTAGARVQLYRSMVQVVAPNDELQQLEFDGLESQLELDVRQRLSLTDEMATDFLSLKAHRLVNFGRCQEAEATFREALQITLNTFGPRDDRAIHAIGSLGRIIATSIILKADVGDTAKDHSNAQRSLNLARTAVRLQKEKGELLNSKDNRLVAHLLFVLRTLGELQEAVQFGQMIVQKSTLVLGEDHPDTLQYMSELGVTYRELGLHNQCVNALQKVLKLSKFDDTGASINRHLWFMQELGKAFRGLQNHKEAKACLEEGFWVELRLFGPLTNDSKLMCSLLGDSYARLGQYQQASDLYDQYSQALRDSEAGEHPWINEVQQWKIDLNRLISTELMSDIEKSLNIQNDSRST